jgi:phage terminase large subunit-like protein
MADLFTLEHFRAWAAGLILDSGKPWTIEPFQEEFLADVFSGFRECWLVVPEGNGKSTLVAGLALYHTEFTPDAWVPIAASSRDQARIMYRQAKGFVSRSPMLEGKFRCYDGYRKIDFGGKVGVRSQTGRPEGGTATIEVFASDERTGDGIIPSMCIVDELHRHRSLDLYETWRGKLGKRNAQILTISTAGEPGAPFEETREKIRQSASELTREATFVRAASEQLVLHEWAVPEGGDIEDMNLVAAANPFSGVTAETLAADFASPTMTEGHWRRFKCNLPTRSEFAAIQEGEWFAARSQEEIPAGQPIWAGLDVGWKWDTTALVPLWWRDTEFRLLGPARILTPPRDGSSLESWRVERAIIELHERNPVETVVMDTSRAEQLAQWIADELGADVVDRAQTNVKAVEDYDRFMEALREGWLRHAGDAGLTRHALNAIARVLPHGDARFDRPSKSQKGSAQQDMRVWDALAAASMVHSVAVEWLGVGGGLVFA